jgi:hypothetical protein
LIKLGISDPDYSLINKVFDQRFAKNLSREQIAIELHRNMLHKLWELEGQYVLCLEERELIKKRIIPERMKDTYAPLLLPNAPTGPDYGLIWRQIDGTIRSLTKQIFDMQSIIVKLSDAAKKAAESPQNTTYIQILTTSLGNVEDKLVMVLADVQNSLESHMLDEKIVFSVMNTIRQSLNFNVEPAIAKAKSTLLIEK